jgi:hypothetical protein
MSCKGKQNSGNDGKGGVSRKYWEVSERQKKAILSQYPLQDSWRLILSVNGQGLEPLDFSGLCQRPLIP